RSCSTAPRRSPPAPRIPCSDRFRAGSFRPVLWGRPVNPAPARADASAVNPDRLPEPHPAQEPHQDAPDLLPSSGPVLKAVASAAERFLAAGDWRDCIDEVLAALGEAADTDRVLLFENEREHGPGVPTSMVPAAEWTAPGVARVTGRPDMNGHSYRGHE